MKNSTTPQPIIHQPGLLRLLNQTKKFAMFALHTQKNGCSQGTGFWLRNSWKEGLSSNFRGVDSEEDVKWFFYHCPYWCCVYPVVSDMFPAYIYMYIYIYTYLYKNVQWCFPVISSQLRLVPQLRCILQLLHILHMRCLFSLLWVKQCHLHHLPVITIFIDGVCVCVYHSQSWVVYDIVLPTLSMESVFTGNWRRENPWI